VLQLKTQTPEYWQEDFVIEDEDIEYLYEYLAGQKTPCAGKELARVLIEKRCQHEAKAIEQKLAQGVLYLPKRTYEVGQRLVFPIFDFALGTVVGVRPGHNPAYGDFQVIQVELEGQKKLREFAAALEAPHELNGLYDEERLLSKENLLSPAEIFATYGDNVYKRLVRALRENADAGFVEFRDQWLVREKLAEIHIGHLNIAEAAIEVAGKPQPPEALIEILELPKEIPEPIKLFSLNQAMNADDRFDDAGFDGQIRWYLRRLQPEQILNTPFWLVYHPTPYVTEVDPDLLLLERNFGDEMSDPEIVSPPPGKVQQTTLTLIFPHWQSGTIPVNPTVQAMLPKGTEQHTLITLIDAHTGQRRPAWISHQGRYIYGLQEWYQKNNIPVGAIIHLERTNHPEELVIDADWRRMKRQWVRVAHVEGHRLSFQMQKQPIACEYDEDILIGVENTAAIVEIRQDMEASNKDLFQIMCDIFPELSKLSPQGTVHAKTLYSAVNILKRVPPGPIFAELCRRPCFIHIGNHLWVFDESRKADRPRSAYT